jgi:hypothetical protein
MNAEALAALFLSVQMTFPPIPHSAEEHGIGKHPSLSDKSHSCLSMWCCTLKDCRPLAQGAVRITPVGWSVPLPDGRRVVVSFNDKAIRTPSPECAGQEFGQSYWACYNQIDGEWKIRCFYPRGGLF